MVQPICAGKGLSPQANQEFEEAIEKILGTTVETTVETGEFVATVVETGETTVSNVEITTESTIISPVNIPNGSEICLEEDGSISTYKTIRESYLTNYEYRNFAPGNNACRNFYGFSGGEIILQDGDVCGIEEINQEEYIDLEAQPASLKTAGEFIKAQAQKESFAGLLQGLVNFLGIKRSDSDESTHLTASDLKILRQLESGWEISTELVYCE